jgi:glutamine synthetase
MLPPGVSFVAVQWVDLQGRAKARLVPRSGWPATCAPGGGVPVHGGLVAIPDPSTLVVLPTRPHIAIAYATLHDGERVAGCDARAILARVQARAAEGGPLPVAGLRPRFALAPFDEHGVGDPRDDLGSLLRASPLLAAVVAAAQGLDWQVDELAHEEAPGTFAIGLSETDALRAADRFALLRTVVADVASGHGMTAAFGPGLRVRLSAFADIGAFAAGLRHHAHALSALTTGGHAQSAVRRGGDWVQVGPVDGAANPYLVLAGLVAAGLDGIDRALDGDAAEPSLSPAGALAALQADAVLRDALGDEAVGALRSS